MKRSIGESQANYQRKLDLGLDLMRLDIPAAQRVADWVCSTKTMVAVEVQPGREAAYKNGSWHRRDSRCYISLNPRGQTLATLLHELAHRAQWCSQLPVAHDRGFKQLHAKMIDLFGLEMLEVMRDGHQ